MPSWVMGLGNDPRSAYRRSEIPDRQCAVVVPALSDLVSAIEFQECRRLVSTVAIDLALRAMSITSLSLEKITAF